jgi:DNA-directed RNA polymerase subunit RPC12/RpoP
MLTIKCARCKRKIFKYEKIGKGKVLRCYKDKIKEDHSIHDGNLIKCSCGNIIGRIEANHIKMKQHAFIYTGTKI